MWVIVDERLWQGIEPAQNGQMVATMNQIVPVFGQYPGEPGPVRLTDDLGNGLLDMTVGQ